VFVLVVVVVVVHTTAAAAAAAAAARPVIETTQIFMQLQRCLFDALQMQQE
jgi:hypothetical protein